MAKYTEHAVDLVEKRKKLIEEGYKMPSESADTIAGKLAGFNNKKNVWKIFTRMIMRKKVKYMRKLSDAFHARKKEMTKEEKEIRLKESEAMYDAADQGNKKLVKVALRYFADVDHLRQGRTAFQMIFIRCCWIDAGLEIEPSWQDGWEDQSTRADYDGVMNILLNAGANINQIEGENTDGMAVVHHAARLGCYERVKFFVENGGIVDIKNSQGDTALMKACEGGHLDIIMFLIYAKANLYEKNIIGMTVLHFAAMDGNLNVLKFLLESGCDKNVEDDEGLTCLDICNMRGFKHTAEYLSKFVMPKAPMQPLIAYWEMLRMGDRPESRSWAGYLRKDEVERAASRERMSSRGSDGGSEGIGRRKNRAQIGRASLDVDSFKKNLGASIKKNKRKSGGGATFNAKGGKEAQKKAALKAKQAKREEIRRRQDAAIAEANKDPRGALGMLEKKMAQVDKKIAKKQKNIAKMKRVERTTAKKDEAEFERLWGEIGGFEEEENIGEEAVDADDLVDGGGVFEDENALTLQTSPSKFASFKQTLFSPIGKFKYRGKQKELVVDEFGEIEEGKGGGARQGIKSDFMSRITGAFSPMKKYEPKVNNLVVSPPPIVNDINAQSHADSQVGIEGEPGISPTKKKKRKKKKREGRDGDGADPLTYNSPNQNSNPNLNLSSLDEQQRNELERNKNELAELKRRMSEASPNTKKKRNSVSFHLPALGSPQASG